MHLIQQSCNKPYLHEGKCSVSIELVYELLISSETEHLEFSAIVTLKVSKRLTASETDND